MSTNRPVTNVDISDHIRRNHPANTLSLCRRKPVYGVGINDSDYVTQPTINGRKTKCPAVTAWNSMLQRSYNEKEKARHPNYIGTTVCNEWLKFMTFRAWWSKHQVDGWHIDKDLIKPGNKEYSPESCVFVPQWLNKLTTDHAAGRGETLIGTHHCKVHGGYLAYCSNPTKGKLEHLGRFPTENEAHQAWKTRKMEIATELKPKMDEIDRRIYDGVVLTIKEKHK